MQKKSNGHTTRKTVFILGTAMSINNNYIRWFNELTIHDVPLVGGKNASLGEMYRELAQQGINIPNGFAVTAEGYRYLLDQASAWEPLHQALDDLNPDDVDDLSRRARKAREIIYAAPLPNLSSSMAMT